MQVVKKTIVRPQLQVAKTFVESLDVQMEQGTQFYECVEAEVIPVVGEEFVQAAPVARVAPTQMQVAKKSVENRDAQMVQGRDKSERSVVAGDPSFGFGEDARDPTVLNIGEIPDIQQVSMGFGGDALAPTGGGKHWRNP